MLGWDAGLLSLGGSRLWSLLDQLSQSFLGRPLPVVRGVLEDALDGAREGWKSHATPKRMQLPHSGFTSSHWSRGQCRAETDGEGTEDGP